MDNASGPIATAKSYFRDMLSRCTALQEIDGASFSAAELLERIYLDGAPLPAGNADNYTRAELEQLRPFAVVWMPSNRGFLTRHTSSGGRQGFTPSGVLAVDIYRSVPEDEQHDPAAADRSFENTLGRVIQSNDWAEPGLAELSASNASSLQLGSIVLEDLDRCPVDKIPSEGDYQVARIVVTWGVDT